MTPLAPYYISLFASIGLSVTGQVLLKTGALRSAGFATQFLNPWTITGLFTYGLAAVFYIIAIKRIPITLAFPTLSLSYVAVALIAHFAWHEELGLAQLAAIALITGGVVLLHQSWG